MRRGMNTLALQVQQELGRDPHAGDLYVFRGRRGDLVKILWHDGLGFSLYAKRLERGRFVWPAPVGGAVPISAAQLAYMLDGIDWRNLEHDLKGFGTDSVQRMGTWCDLHGRNFPGSRIAARPIGAMPMSSFMALATELQFRSRGCQRILGSGLDTDLPKPPRTPRIGPNAIGSNPFMAED